MDKEKSNRLDLDAESELWDTYRLLLSRRGGDLQKIAAAWADKQAQFLPSPGARMDWLELCEKGCASEILALIIALLRYTPLIQRFWAETVGEAQNRQATIRALENAASALEVLFAEWKNSYAKEQEKAVESVGHVPPLRIAEELRLYCRVLNLGETLAEETEIRSLVEVARYLLASYVERATGRFHDRSVSGILAEVVGPRDYNEVAQRMWRNRNYSRLSSHLSPATDFLFAMGLVIQSQRNASS